MFLRSLTLKGFKSFAEPTTLEFEPGLTVVVGPNGSGKSNVVDAVAWVLGAQGPRTVRSSKMDDVIFAGTGRRPALGRAEVSLTIDNTRGVLPIDFTEVTITRTLFRSSGESEYTLNGVPCRLLDLQELLSDSGVGRQQHVIVSQGNLDAVLDSRPEDRRLIVEEAAGILKFRRRKEKAERRLEGTEANLLRLTDLLREVGRQLRPLERQAEAARRHGDLVGELHALRVFLRGREVAALTARHEAALEARAGLVADEARVNAELGVLDRSVAAAEDRVSALGRARLGEIVGRMEAMRERTRGLAAVVAERRRSVGRDLAVSVDSALLAALDDDAARLRAELDDVDAAAQGMAARFAELAEAEAEVARDREALGEPVRRVDAAAEARGELGALRANLDRGRADLARLEHRLAGLEGRAAALGDEGDRVGVELARLAAAESAAVAALALAEAERQAAAVVRDGAETEAREARDGLRTWSARADALALAVDESRGRGDTDRLAGLDGVLGSLLDLVEVDPGFEAAFEAAVVDAVGAVVVDGVGAGRRLLDRLARAAAAPPGGVLPLGPSVDPSPLPRHCPGRPLRAAVRSAHPGVDRLLGHLLARVVVVDGGWEEAVDVTLAFPDVVAVTRTGDRFSAVGWRFGVGAPGVTRAALDDARARVEQAAEAVSAAEARLAEATAGWTAAVAAAEGCASEASSAAARYRQLDAAATMTRADARRVATETDEVRAQRDRILERIEHEAARVAELESLLPALDDGEAIGAARAAAERADRARVQSRAEALAARRAELEVRAAGLHDSRTAIARRLAEVESRLAGAASRRQEAESRRGQLVAARSGLERLGPHLDRLHAELDAALADVRRRGDAQARALAEGGAALDQLRRRRQGAERSLAELRERSGRAELEATEARLRLEAAVDSLRNDLDCEPAEAVAASCPPLPPGTSAAARARELERELRLMGPVNPLALQELEALQERHSFLTGQLDDVKGSRRELVKIIRAVEAEMSELLAAALADVTEHFTVLFEALFPGGQGRVRVTDPDHVLEAGIELECRPAGKNVRKLSLLSGGERALCALAFLFAVFRSRPSPFYLLDEVEAALDDVNLHRFIDLLREFRDEAQLVVVTHQKRTMEAADALYGVTLQPGGSSKVVSERVAARA